MSEIARRRLADLRAELKSAREADQELDARIARLEATRDHMRAEIRKTLQAIKALERELAEGKNP